MKIDRLSISNFRGIENVVATGLGNTIIVAGQNGSGKSCLFDAIRMLKSTYGGYQVNEFQHFFGEFQIALQGGSVNLLGLFNDKLKPLVIEAVFTVSDAEKQYISANAKSLLEEIVWQTVLPEAYQWGGYHKALFSVQFRERQPEVDAKVNAALPNLYAELTQPSILGRIQIAPDASITLASSQLLSVIFSTYKPRNIGVIDYHGSQRHYNRENVQGINLNLEVATQTYSQSTLYNYSNKYNNVKSEMAGSYIKAILSEKASPNNKTVGPSLNATLKELFEAFFPDKEFLGPCPTKEGTLSFPVRTKSGNEHDLDDLSSGEKEILYGYLRIRSSAPHDSIILLDEPELHLNPRLIRGLPEFYRKHLGENLRNQIWLVTHSDALIREAVGKPGFNVFHMLPCGADVPTASQLRPLTVTGDLDLVLTDLVGDLAAYRPGGKGLIFEGGGDSEFDKNFTNALFSTELRGINLISSNDKTKVNSLQQILSKAYDAGDLPTKFYAITDRDTEGGDSSTPSVNRFSWDVYHIENYLLDAELIADSMNTVLFSKSHTTENVDAALAAAARKSVPSVLNHRMRVYANSKLVHSIELGFNPKTTELSKDLSEAVSRSSERFVKAVVDELTEAKLAQKEHELREQIETGFVDGTWRKILPGREILKQFVTNSGTSVGYENLRNVIIGKMQDEGRKPPGMKAIIDAIVAD